MLRRVLHINDAFDVNTENADDVSNCSGVHPDHEPMLNLRTLRSTQVKPKVCWSICPKMTSDAP